MNSKKQLVINIISNIIAYGTSLAITFVLTPYLINTLGKEAYSFYPLANNFVSYFMIISNALNSMASRFITVSLSRKQDTQAQTYFTSVFMANILMTILLAIPMFLIVGFLPEIFNIPPEMVTSVQWLFGLVFLANLINVFTSVFGVATFATNRLDLKSGSEIFQGIVRLGLYLALYAIFRPSIVYVGVVTLVIAIVNLSFQIFFTRKLLPSFKIRPKLFDLKSIWEIFTSGIWNSLNSLGNILLVSMALFLSNMLLGASASGDLSIVQTVPSFLTSIISVLFTVFMPRINFAYASDDKNELVNEVRFSQKVLGLFTTTPIVLIMIFGVAFFQLWIGVDYEISLYLNQLSVLTIIPLLIHANMWTVYGVTIARNDVKMPALILIVAGVLNVIVTWTTLSLFDFGEANIYVIPVISGLINVLYYFIFLPSFVSSRMGIKRSTFYPPMLKSLLYAAIYYMIGRFIVPQLEINTWIEFFIYGGIAAIIGYVLHAVMTINRKELQNGINLVLRR